MKPRFTTISPTHIAGKKPVAWNNFRDGGYVAIGWMDEDLTGKSPAQIAAIIRSNEYDNEDAAIAAFTKFMSLKVGDLIGVNNTNNGLFGIGVIESEYKFKKHIHDSGSNVKDEFYSHYREVKWLDTEYHRRQDIIREGETAWMPYGTIGAIFDEVPDFVRRVLGKEPLNAPQKIEKTEPPAWLNSLIAEIRDLKSDPRHQERGHESLVEGLFAALGYKKHVDIKFRLGSVDVTLTDHGKALSIVEVKRDWDFSQDARDKAVTQGYRYAHERGARHVIITNGDTYFIFDRLKGLSYESNFIGEFRLSEIDEDGLKLIERLRKENLSRIDLAETLRHMSESFAVDAKHTNDS